MATWYVTNGRGYRVGAVEGATESEARCAALHAFGISEEEAADLDVYRYALMHRILPDDSFDLSRA